MTDLLKSVTSNLGSFVLSWTLPVAIAVLSFSYLVLIPSKVALGQALQRADSTTLAVGYTVVVVGGAVLLAGTSTTLYRLLEGYLWPANLKRWGVKHQRSRMAVLKKQRELAKSDLDRALIDERLNRFPVDPEQIAPSAFGNAMRAFETFSVDRYRLDSQTFWIELTTVVPGELRSELGRSRSNVDFFVAQVFLSILLTLLSGTVLLAHPSEPLWPLALMLLGLVSVPAFYQAAVSSTTYWQSTVRAMVNLGRGPLAQHLGLRMPETLEGEREMWEKLAAFHYYPFDESWVGLLDDYRARPNRLDPKPPSGTAGDEKLDC